MAKELSNFIMLGTDAKGVEYRIEMTLDETQKYRDSGYCEYFDMAEETWQMACERCGIEYGDWPDMITEEEA
jgi:hypothetical protein